MNKMNKLTHLDRRGLPRMVDVSEKPQTLREAEAEAVLWVGSDVMSAVRQGRTQKATSSNPRGSQELWPLSVRLSSFRLAIL